MKSLQKLRLYRTKVRDYTALRKATELRELFINGSTERDFAYLRTLPQLHSLSILRAPKLEVFPELTADHRLERLQLWTCKRLADVSALAALPRLRHVDILEIGLDQPSDFEWLVQLPQVETVSVQFGSQ